MNKNKFQLEDLVVLSDSYVAKHKKDLQMLNQLGVGKIVYMLYDYGRQRTLYRVQFDVKPEFKSEFNNTKTLNLYSYELKLNETQKDSTRFSIGDKVYISEIGKKYFKEHHTASHTDLEKQYTVKKVVFSQEDKRIIYFLDGITEYVFFSEDLIHYYEKPKVEKKIEMKEITTNVPEVFEALIPGIKVNGIKKEYENTERDKQDISNMKKEWNRICDDYLRAFCKKHDFDYYADCWVGSDPGTIADIDDMFVSMDNIRYDIDNEIPKEKFEKWYWKNLDVYEITGQTYMNFESYCKGAPDYWTDERMKKIRESKNRIEKLKKQLEEDIKNIQNNKSLF